MICFSVIDRCNWDCDYCIAGTQRRYNKNKPALTEEKFKKMLKDLEETSYKLANNPKSVGSDNNSFVFIWRRTWIIIYGRDSTSYSQNTSKRRING